MPDSNTPSPVTAGSPVLIPSGQFKDQPVFALTDLSILVGEDTCCELQLLAAAHGVHALLVTSPEGVYIRNFIQPGHLRINGQAIREESLKNGDDVQIGQFTFKFYFENQSAAQTPAATPPCGVEFTGGQLPIGGRCAVIGTSPLSDFRLNDPNSAERHAVFFSSQGKWFLRDLGSAFGTLVNGEPIRQAQIKPGDLIQVGGTSMRWTDRIRTRPQSPAGENFSAVGNPGMGSMMLGGMPVTLPPTPQPPKTFGRVSVSFDGKTLPNRRDQEPRQAPAAEPVIQNNEAESGESPTLARTPVSRRFPSVPKIRSQPAEEPQEQADEMGEASFVPDVGPFGVQTIDGLGQPVLLGSEEIAASGIFGEGVEHLSGFGGDAFGGQPLVTNEHIPMSDSTAIVESNAEIEDFAESKFWDMTDDEQADVPLPARERDFSPPIPPVGTTFTLVGGDMGNVSATVIGDVVEPAGEMPASVSVSEPGQELGTADFQDPVFGEPLASGADVPPTTEEKSDDPDSANRTPRPHVPLTLDRSPLRRPAPGAQLPPDVSALIVPAAPVGPPRRTVAILMTAMLICMAIASSWIWFMLPSHYTLEGRMGFVNVPAPNTPDWTAFQTDQRTRVGSSAVVQAALASLQAEHPRTTPGFLAAGSKQFADATQAARFETNLDGSANLVIAISGTNATDDGERLGELLNALFAADNDLTAAAAAAQKALSDWEPNVASRQQDISDLDSQIAQKRQVIAAGKAVAPSVAALTSATDDAGNKYLNIEKTIAGDETQLLVLNRQLDSQTAPTTQPAEDAQWADLHQQITDATGSMESLENQEDVVVVSRTQGAMAADQRHLDQALADAASVLKLYPDVNDLIHSTLELQQRVAVMVDQLAQRRQMGQGKLEDFQRLIDETSRRREEALSEAEPQIPSLRDQLGVLEKRIEAAEADDSTISEADRTEMRRDASRISRQLDSLRRPFRGDDVNPLHQNVNLLIEGARADLNGDTQLIDDTLQALIARLSAAPPPPPEMTAEQKKTILTVVILIQNVAQDQANYAAAVASGGEDTEAITALQQQATELSEQADSRLQVISATQPTDDDQRHRLAAQRDDLIQRIRRERAEMEADHTDFVTKATASVSAALSVQEARDATRALNALLDTRSAKQDDLNNLTQNRDDLEAKVKSATDVVPPNEQSVRIVSDDTGRKWEYTIAAVLGIGLIFGILTLISGGPRPAGGNPPRWQGAKAEREAQTPTPVAG